jgi:hypothetical protein
MSPLSVATAHRHLHDEPGEEAFWEWRVVKRERELRQLSTFTLSPVALYADPTLRQMLWRQNPLFSLSACRWQMLINER